MKQYMNYITSLPDFIAMQRVSFCWFIAQGLTEELAMFSRIRDFSQNTEYVLFGQEYSLMKPVYKLTKAKKYIANYAAQLVIPLEVRNKKINSVRYHNEFPIINLPLMTTAATFVINGCERVIVSQIIRSPGIYFEKNKNQRSRTRFKRKLSGDIKKLRSFIISGDVFVEEYNIFFPYPITNKEDQTIIANWNKVNIIKYSLNYLKRSEKNSSFYFLECFKIYRIISKAFNHRTKENQIQIFLKWLYKLNSLKENQILYLLIYFNLLLKFLIRYETLKNSLTAKEFSVKRYLKISQTYDKIIRNSQKNAQIQLNYKSITLTNQIGIYLKNFNNFTFLKTNLNDTTTQIRKMIRVVKDKRLKPTLYFSTSLKEKFKYNLQDFKKGESLIKLNNPDRHKYLKAKTQILSYKENHEIKDNYHDKYKEKDLYTATLIPEYGSWIRFGFQKNTNINLYKYPIKNQEDEIIVQLDKVTQKPILHLLKEMGLTDLEICRSLHHSDFFYFNNPFLTNSVKLEQPLLRFELNSAFYNNISEFSRIFDPAYYRLGKVGRFKLNNRLNLKLSQRLQIITYEDIFAIIDQLITLSVSKIAVDDIDHLKNRRVRSVGELLQNLFRIGFQRLLRKLRSQTNKSDSGQLSSFNIVGATIREFFGSSQLSQYMDQTNPLSSLTHRRRISGLGPGGFDRDRISFAVRDIHPSHYGRICPIETPEGQNVGLIASLTICARVNKSGFLETPFWRVLNGKVIKTGNPIYLTAEIEDFYKIAPADISTNEENYLTKNLIPVRYKQDFITVTPFEVDFIAISPIQVVSVAASLIPFFEHDDANRALMGSNMQRQSVPLILPQKPIVGTGLENQVAIDSGMTINAPISGIVDLVTADQIILKDKLKNK